MLLEASAAEEDEAEDPILLELPLVEKARLASATALSDLTDFDLESYGQSAYRIDGRAYCAYALAGRDLQTTIRVDQGVACPVLAHARLWTLPQLAMDALTLKRVLEPGALSAQEPFSEESERAALRWLREQIDQQATDLDSNFAPPRVEGEGDGSGKLRLAHKATNPATGRSVGSIDMRAVSGYTLSARGEVELLQRSLLYLKAKLELAGRRCTAESVADRTACCVVPLPRGREGGSLGAALVVGGPGRAGPVEAIDLSRTGDWVALPQMPGVAAGCAAACAAVAPVASKSGRKLRPAVFVIGGLCGSRLLDSVRAYDPSAPSGEEWTAVRVPPLPRPRSSAGVGLVLPRSWMLPQ